MVGKVTIYNILVLYYYILLLYIYTGYTVFGGGIAFQGYARCETHHISKEGEDGSFNLKQVNDVKKIKLYSIHTYTRHIYILKYYILTESKGNKIRYSLRDTLQVL